MKQNRLGDRPNYVSKSHLSSAILETLMAGTKCACSAVFETCHDQRACMVASKGRNVVRRFRRRTYVRRREPYAADDDDHEKMNT